MASRMNTKFIVILVAGVVAMLGAVFAAYTVVSKSAADLAALGDQAMAEGEYRQAAKHYSKAVNKDTTTPEYSEKWIGALENWVPETQTAYRDAFRSDYLLAVNHAATVQRTDVDAYERELGIQLQMLLNGYSRGAADRLIERTTEALGYFDGFEGVDERWPVLRRYRGIAWELIGRQGGVVDPETYPLVREDLEASLAVRPGDDRARAGLMRWIVYVAAQNLRGDDIEPIQNARTEAIEMGLAHLEAHPESPLVATTEVLQRMNRDRIKDAVGLQDMQRSDVLRASMRRFAAEVRALHGRLMEMDPETIEIEVINNMMLLEGLSSPENKFTLSGELVSRVLEELGPSASNLYKAAEIASRQGDPESAIGYYEQITALEPRPLSVEGLELFTYKRRSLMSIASIRLDQLERLSGQPDAGAEEVASLKEKAVEARDAYADRVSEDDAMLTLIDGRIAMAGGEPNEALRKFRRFNEQTNRQNISGLWHEAMAARRLNQLGTTRDALSRMLEINENNTQALLMLGDTQRRLQNLAQAREAYNRVLRFDSQNQAALSGIRNLDAIENPETLDDPIRALVLTARQLRRGVDGNPGDLSSAIEVLQEGIEGVDYDPGVTRELVSMLLDNGDVRTARETILKASEIHPDSALLAPMREAVKKDDPVDILIELIRQTEEDPVERDLAIAGVAYQRQRAELLDEKLASLLERAPNHKGVIDLGFVRALGQGDLELARELAERGAEVNADRVNGLSYRARIASQRDEHEEAVRLLEQAVASGSADSSIYRMLGLERRALGRTSGAVEAFESALSIRPDDQQTIVQYILTLDSAGRSEEALDAARRFQRYAMDNSRFLSMWLELESRFGGGEGRDFAIKQREKFLELNPGDMINKRALASNYIEAEEWDKAKGLIDELRSTNDSIQLALLEARWYADQGRVGSRSGILVARNLLRGYIESLGEDAGAVPYVRLARFMLERGRTDMAIQAASDAVAREDPETMAGTKLMGDLLLNLNQYTDAAAAYQKVVDAGLDPNNEYRTKLVDMLIRTRQYERARAQMEGLADERRGSMVSLLQLAEIEQGLGNDAEALDYLDQAVTEYSDNPIVYIKRAEFLSGSEEALRDMLADIDAALQINPNDWRAYRVRAAGYFAVDRRDDAMRDLKRAVRLNPNLDQALYGIINEMMIDGREAEAFDFAQEIVEQRPKDVTLINSLGQLFSSRDEWAYAVEMYKTVWELQRSPSAGATLIDTIARTEDPDTDLANAVINDLSEVAGDLDTSPGLLAAQALVLKARGREQLAVQQLTKAFDLSADDDGMLMQWSGNLSRLYTGEPVTEQLRYLQSLKQRNTNREVLSWIDLFIAQRLARSGTRPDEAAQLFERLVGVGGLPLLRKTAYKDWGTMLYSMGDRASAADIWRRGLEEFSDDWEMNNNLAYLLSDEFDRHEEALGYAEHAVDAGPRRSEPYDTIARIYTELDRYDEARQMLGEGMRFASTVPDRITLMLAGARIDLAEGDTASARSKLVNIRSLFRATPTRSPSLEERADEIESEIESAKASDG